MAREQEQWGSSNAKMENSQTRIKRNLASVQANDIHRNFNEQNKKIAQSSLMLLQLKAGNAEITFKT